MRLLACDPGKARHGFALSDTAQTLVARAWWEPAGDDPAAAVVAVANREGVAEVVLGLPLRMAGGESLMSEWVRGVAAVVEAEGLTVHLRDERLTTPKGAGKGERDALAARAILQMELDRRRRLGAG